mgnify:CR=1 FL=1|jgi:hypothetical protein
MEPILKKIRTRLNDLADNLAVGCASDYAAYREIVGTISGLAEVERMILDHIESLRAAEDFEE